LETVVPKPDAAELIRPYEKDDYQAVVNFWARINRELAPPHMRQQFEEYIATALASELRQLQDVFSMTKRNAFWVVVDGAAIVGTFGIESRGEKTTELRRMYLDRPYRCRGIAQRMLQCAEMRARELGFTTMILSTAEVQKAALKFYQKTGYQLTKTEVAETMSTKTVGGGLTRYHFQKLL
jgi:GNAT superfamily N-acetyltransferase